MIKNSDEKAARKLLKEQKFGHLGCVLESGEPYVVPVNYLFKDDEIYIHSLPGQKFDALRANGKVCLYIDSRFLHFDTRSGNFDGESGGANVGTCGSRLDFQSIGVGKLNEFVIGWRNIEIYRKNRS